MNLFIKKDYEILASMNKRSLSSWSALSAPRKFVWCVRKCEMLIKRTFNLKKSQLYSSLVG
ncbi:hypothetical protein THOM_0090 [Trachipleistophora hominis]|uniref:Uncharacterized protein n=1 Tax=Trachipleistophora hominis TaxID=72359 RepID=L7JZM8_TRAHO|nr:hypothetical protein THOM_0090 [Trachipleistophora hominis]